MCQVGLCRLINASCKWSSVLCSNPCLFVIRPSCGWVWWNSIFRQPIISYSNSISNHFTQPFVTEVWWSLIHQLCHDKVFKIFGDGGWWLGGGFIISTLRPCITFMGKKKEENTPTCSSFKPALAQAPCLQAEHSTKSSCLFFIFPWEEILLNTFLQAASHCFQIGWKCFCSYGFLDKMDNKL